MYHIRSNAEASVRNLLRDVVERLGRNVLEAEDYMDDGTAVGTPFPFVYNQLNEESVAFQPDPYQDRY